MAAKREGAETVFARVRLEADAEMTGTVEFGYSDRVRVCLNDRLLYAGDIVWRLHNRPCRPVSSRNRDAASRKWASAAETGNLCPSISPAGSTSSVGLAKWHEACSLDGGPMR